MALGNSSLNNVRTYLENISNYIKYGNYETSIESVYSCWNTYQYVANNLKEWADDTTIGAETKQNLLKLSKILEDLIQETLVLLNKLKAFSQQQMNINDPNDLTKYIKIDNEWYVYGSGELNAKLMGLR